ncbi:hypothetical protein LZ578_03275 [Jeotgalibaca sp. MA1X17-3]|uniref:hypothetical protein n=1 Tax=Jeotgalibaca sp. MA1X17-3 TaxID=2908211 RepID=UPI001F2C314A|nr:hypothetical protein [Jeotgalibaca sp. MA1X17-3]UJF16169.1 hypothetical protein LZ578_03275 [Jeotgalibaca sp. MA1X17-3]
MFGVMFKLKKFFKDNRKDYIISFTTMLGSNIFNVIIPYLIGRIIDSIIRKELTAPLLSTFSIIFLVSLIVAYLLEFVWSYYLFTGAAKLQKECVKK